MTMKDWNQNIILISRDPRFREIALGSLGERSAVHLVNDGDEAIQLMEFHQFKIFILDDQCLSENTDQWTPGVSALDICHEAHKNHVKPKIIILSQDLKKNGSDYLEKTKAMIIMNRDEVSSDRLIYLVRILRNRIFRTILSRDFIKAKTFKCPLYIFNPLSLDEKGDETGYDLFIDVGESIQAEHLKQLISNHVYHLYVKENELHLFLDSFPEELSSSLFSSKLNTVRKDYRSFLLDFFDGTKIGNDEEGEKTFKKGQLVIEQLSNMIASFDDPIICLQQLPYPRMSELSHGLNSALYTLIFGRLCELKESPKEIALAALIHNIGVMDVDQSIVIKDHKTLSAAEKNQYKKHVHYSIAITKKYGPLFSTNLFHNVLMYHHENFDGSGYPDGLMQDKIPDEAELVAIASSYDYLKTVHRGEKILSPQETYNQLQLIKDKYNPNLLQSIKTLFK